VLKDKRKARRCRNDPRGADEDEEEEDDDDDEEKKQLRILDVGCGNGYTLLSLHEEGFENLHGSDYSQEALSLASAIFSSNEIDSITLHVRFPFFFPSSANLIYQQIDDATATSLEADSFDVSCCDLQMITSR